MQARYLIGQWEEIYEQSAGKGRVGNAVGGCVFQWADGWWKFGQESRLDIHDTNASWPNGGYVEDYVPGENNMNEEWWGICAKGFPDSRGLFDLYHSWWFQALLILLCLNLAACVFERAPREWKAARRAKTPPPAPSQLRSYPVKEEINNEEDKAGLRGILFSFSRSVQELTARRGLYSRREGAIQQARPPCGACGTACYLYRGPNRIVLRVQGNHRHPRGRILRQCFH
jgi:hypothetical protein